MVEGESWSKTWGRAPAWVDAAACRIRREQENGFSSLNPEPPEGTCPAGTLALVQSRLIFVFHPLKLSDNKSVLFKATRFVVIYYDSSRKLIQLPSPPPKTNLGYLRHRAPPYSPLLTCTTTASGSMNTAARPEFKEQRHCSGRHAHHPKP